MKMRGVVLEHSQGSGLGEATFGCSRLPCIELLRWMLVLEIARSEYLVILSSHCTLSNVLGLLVNHQVYSIDGVSKEVRPVEDHFD